MNSETDAGFKESQTIRLDRFSDIAPTPGPGDSAPNNQFEVGSALRVDDVMFLTTVSISGACCPSDSTSAATLSSRA